MLFLFTVPNNWQYYIQSLIFSGVLKLVQFFRWETQCTKWLIELFYWKFILLMFWHLIVSFKLRTRQYLGVRISSFTAIEPMYRYIGRSFLRLLQIVKCLRQESGDEESDSEFSRRACIPKNYKRKWLRLQKLLKILCCYSRIPGPL